MRILYGVVGEGMGHAIRSRVVLDELARDHQIEVVVSGRAHDYLKVLESERLGVNRIWGLSLVYEDNRVRNFQTLLANVKGALVAGGWPENIRAFFDLAERFRPDVVVSDFESWSYLFARMNGLPVISIDNQQIVSRCDIPPEITAGHEADAQLTRAIVKAKLPGCLHYLVTTFFYPLVERPRTTLMPPILRPTVLSARPGDGEHLLVYQTSTSDSALLETLRASGVECRIYGVRRGIQEEQREGNLRFRPFSDEGFVDDLRTARGVVANGGFTLLGEAVYLHRPVLSVPVHHQFEQVLNARYLEREGYGAAAEAVTPEVLARFLERIPVFRSALERYQQDGNRALFTRLDGLLASVASGEAPPAPPALS